VGRSNVGKSSFINAILRKKAIARVSQTPGKTQAIHFYLIDDRYYIVDLPGYGYAKVPKTVAAKWGELVRSYLEQADSLEQIFLLVDIRRTPTGEDLMMHRWLEETGVRWRAVMTKVDKVSRNQRAVGRKTIEETLPGNELEPIAFSSVTREGVDEVWREIYPVVRKKSDGSRSRGGRHAAT
jgi:GTP-binding protein